ncbi:MAG TPA: hypothetical protein VK427_27950 [Kofleriaceae bacterium]|nr:hypothetical protein [Kofleriaceae bacterium]
MTFRDYAMAVMQNQIPTAIGHLEVLLGLGTDDAHTATTHFQAQMKDPSFMQKAMSLRTAVESGSDDDIGNILVECFGLDDGQRATAVATIRASYPR